MKKGTEPAFPLVEQKTDLNIYNGINIRLYLAGMAMQGLMANPYIAERISGNNGMPVIEEIVNIAIQSADELIIQEEGTRNI